MPKARYSSLTVTHVEAGELLDTEDLTSGADDGYLGADEHLLPSQLAHILHGNVRRVDHLVGDGHWAHGLQGV